MTEQQLLALFQHLFRARAWPISIRFVEGIYHVRNGLSVLDAAREIRTSKNKLQGILDAPDPVAAALGGFSHSVTDEARTKAHRALGQMLVGRCAEMVFEDLYRDIMQSEELELVNVSEGGTDTDYRLLNGQGRKLFRINIKFFGSQFRNAREWVGLDPDDCFALATYKIKSALEKQEEEGKPFFFAIVGVPHLTAETVGKGFPVDVLDAVALVLASSAPRKRAFEDAIIDVSVRDEFPIFTSTYNAIRAADWYVLSARKSAKLLHELLFERVIALTVRNFTRVFPGAEVDMHFSLSEDLTPITAFFDLLKAEGVVKVSTLLERGDM